MKIIHKIIEKLPNSFRDTLYLTLFGLFKVPLLFYIRPKVIKLDDQTCIIKVPFKRRNKNHLGSMYFGVLASAADCTVGLAAMKAIFKSENSVSLAFKDFYADFHKRAEGDVYFECMAVSEIRSMVEQVLESEDRINKTFTAIATCPSKFGDEPIASFSLTLSLKKKS